MAVFNANDTTLRVLWSLDIKSESIVDKGNGNYTFVIATKTREGQTASIVFPTSNIPAGSTVVSATLSATATVKREQGTATKGYTFDDAATISLDGTRISQSAFSKDITSKFANMNGGTFTDITIPASYIAKYVQFNGSASTVNNNLVYSYSRLYGNLDSTQLARLYLTDLAITVVYSGDSGGDTPVTKWQKCEVYVCVPVS